MNTRTARLALEGDGLRFAGTSGTGHDIVLDGNDGDTGMRPAELVGVALAGCSGMDVISILRKKRQAVERYEIRTRAEQMDEHPHAFLRIDVVHDVTGAVEVEALRRAIELSATRYCAVGTTLASGVTEIHHTYVLHDASGEEHMGEVVVTGPGRAPRLEPSPANVS